MSTKHNISNALSALKNCVDINVSEFVVVDYSSSVADVLEVMQQHAYVVGYEVFEQKKGVKKIKVAVRFDEKGVNLLKKVVIASKPSVRMYLTVQKLTTLLKKDFYKMYIVSTSAGIMSAVDAIKKKVGGELLCILS